MQDTAPNGFTYADRVQIATFIEKGIIFGASKLSTDPDGRIACRLHPPANKAYVDAYNAGWASAANPDTRTRVVAREDEQRAYWDGYRDRSEGRMKWHLAHCPDHGDHETGCQA